MQGVPYDYFNQYVLIEVNKDSIDFIRDGDIESQNPNYDFEYGYWSNWYKEDELFKKVIFQQRQEKLMVLFMS